MTRIDAKFQELSAKGQKAFGAFINNKAVWISPVW